MTDGVPSFGYDSVLYTTREVDNTLFGTNPLPNEMIYC